MQYDNFNVFLDIIDKFCMFVVGNPILQFFLGFAFISLLYRIFIKIFGIKSITKKITMKKNKNDFDYFFDNERFNYARKGSDKND
ncbi:MAG: hypothetical protein HFI87_02085 [Bacilli bacterium]|nr:hypothetical protein [Bacilli bacterium]